MASPEEYIPTESDFDTIINFEFDGPASASTSASGSSSSAYQIDDQHPFEDYPLPQPPNTDNYDPLAPATKARMRRRRVQQQVVEALPPLPVGEVPEEGRYDWRPRSASAIRQAELDYARRWGKRKVKLSAATGTATRRDRWFPDKEVWRKAAKMEKLGEGDRYFDELARYRAHFEPLLHAEFAEEQRLFLQRLKDWPHQKLIDEGFMLEQLGAKRFKPLKKTDGEVYTFARTGKKGTTDLPFHKFAIGTLVHLSRTDPTVDPVQKDGSIADTSELSFANQVASSSSELGKSQSEEQGDKDAPKFDPSSWLVARVYSTAKGYIRVELPPEVSIGDIEQGHWRLDIGLNEWSLQMQIQAIAALNLDPVAQEMQDLSMERDRLARDLERATSKNQHLASDLDDESQAMSEFLSPHRVAHQTVLAGTALRDITLRAFQEEYIPLASNAASLNADVHGVVPDPTQLKPDDIDATPMAVSTSSNVGEGLLAKNELIQSWAKRYRAEDGREPVTVEGDPEVGLNPSQMRAIAMMLSERLSLVQGPPGTGKTRVIVETIKLLKQHWQIPQPILVCAHTNVAVDNVLAGLRAHGVKAVRFGSEQSMREDLEDHSFSTACSRHPLYTTHEYIKADKERLEKEQMEEATKLPMPNFISRKQALTQRMHGINRVMHREVLLDADVICTTLLSAASRKLQGIDFPMVFLDEASMATEPLSNIALMKGSAHVAIIGDHKQLPPVIISPEAHAGGLATSLFERLIHEKHVPSIMLDTQYRMHPSISLFPNQSFYNSALQDGTLHPEFPGQAKSGFEPPVSDFLLPGKNVTFLDHDHPESPQSKSLANYGDANLVTDLVVDLLHKNPSLRGNDIGIIAPYNAQTRLLKTNFQFDQDDVRAQAIRDVLGEDRAEELGDIEIKTVDGFEGREKAVIIVSFVRSNPYGWVGFLADWRRLNVALTRARRALIMVGSARTLEQAQMGAVAADVLPQGGAKVLRDFIRHLREGDMIMRAD